MSYRITEDEAFNRLIGSVRCKALQKLLILWYNLIFDMESSPVARKIYERVREKNPKAALTKENILLHVRVDEVMEMLGVSERTAKDYIFTLRAMFLGAQKRARIEPRKHVDEEAHAQNAGQTDAA